MVKRARAHSDTTIATTARQQCILRYHTHHLSQQGCASLHCNALHCQTTSRAHTAAVPAARHTTWAAFSRLDVNNSSAASRTRVWLSHAPPGQQMPNRNAAPLQLLLLQQLLAAPQPIAPLPPGCTPPPQAGMAARPRATTAHGRLQHHTTSTLQAYPCRARLKTRRCG